MPPLSDSTVNTLITELGTLASSKTSNPATFQGVKQKKGGPLTGAGVNRAAQIKLQLQTDGCGGDFALWIRAMNAANSLL